MVERVGPGVARFAAGARVTFDSTVSCGTCAYCREGRVNLCDRRTILGVSCARLPARGRLRRVRLRARAHRLSPSRTRSRSSRRRMVEPISVAVHAVSRAPMPARHARRRGHGHHRPARHPGPARRRDCACLRRRRRRGQARPRPEARGGRRASTRRASTCPREVRRLTEGGADVAMECVGATAPIKTAIACVRKGGSVVLVGNISPRHRAPAAAGRDAAS